MRDIWSDYVERVYAGWLGKVIGVRYGAPIEMWSSERIEAFFGELDGYVRKYADFAADDDTNGPLFFIRALEDYDATEALTPMQIGHTLLNYAPYEHGFFWWGGYGISAEDTVYHNLRAGIAAPRSGSFAQNGPVIPEQIGGQIFIDAWGLVVPGDYQKAARYAQKAASVGFDGDGVYGGMFIAACVSAAFADSDVHGVVEKALSTIPEDSGYARMARDIIHFHRAHPESWRDCLAYIKQTYWMDRYPGSCHIIPNAAIIVLSLVYGGGDFTRTINICNMCGFDTDCNVGNVGAIMGVLVGLDGIDSQKWRADINDFQAASSVVGCLNITDAASSALYFARLGYLIAKKTPQAPWQTLMTAPGRLYSFELPGSTQAFRAAMLPEAEGMLHLENADGVSLTGRRSLKVTASSLAAGSAVKVFIKTYYEKEDFSDNRYSPTFSPIAYPGQTIEAALMPVPVGGCPLKASLFAYDVNGGAYLRSKPVPLSADHWTELSYKIEPAAGVCVKEVGVLIEPDDPVRFGEFAGIYLDHLKIVGNADYGIDFARERNWSPIPKPLQSEISQFTRLKGMWRLEEGLLSGSCADFAEAYTGDVAWRDYAFSAEMIPQLGDCHLLLFRVQGAMRGYALCLGKGGMLQLLKNDHGHYVSLAERAFPWQAGEAFAFQIALSGNRIRIASGGEVLIDHADADAPYLSGMIGAGVRDASHCHFGSFHVAQDDWKE